jgi:hypothetical protein
MVLAMRHSRFDCQRRHAWHRVLKGKTSSDPNLHSLSLFTRSFFCFFWQYTINLKVSLIENLQDF